MMRKVFIIFIVFYYYYDTGAYCFLFSRDIIKTYRDTEIMEKEPVKYDGDQVYRVFTFNSKERRKINELEKEGKLIKWAGNTTAVDMFVRKEMVDSVKEFLTNSSLNYRLLVEDVQKLIDEENPIITDEQLNEFQSRKGHRLTFERYHRMADVHSYLDFLKETRSTYVSVIPIGNSVEGRPLKVIKIASGKPNATAMWIDGGIHAREWIAVSSVSYIINELAENRDQLDPEIKDVDFYILPIVNPDGYEYSHKSERLWRKNRQRKTSGFCVGVDLNRNWGYEWGGQGSGKYPCQEIYGGSGPLSEPETKAIADFILQDPTKFKAYVTFHSYGQYILYPWGYSKRVPMDFEDLDRVGRIAAAAMKQVNGSSYTVGNSAGLLYPAAGASDDWAKGIGKIKYTYTIELRDTGRHGFVLPASEIIPTGKEAFAAINENLKKKEHLLENQRKNDECKRSVLKLDIISNELPNFESKNRLLTPIYETGKQVNTLMEKESPKIENSNDIDELLSQFRNLEESKRKLEMELKQCKESFKKREAMLIKDNWHLKVQAQNACRNVPPQIEMLQEKLKDAEEKIVSLTLDYEAAKGNAYELDKLCKKLSNTITKLETSKAEESRLNSPSSRSIMLRSPSSRAQTPSNEEFYRSPKSYKQDYSYMEMEHYSSIDDMERIKELKKSLELMSESLSKEKKVTCELSREIEQMHKENIDYKRQVKELENILKKRLQTNSLAFLGKWENEDFIPSHVKDRLKKYEDELAEKESLILTLRRQLSNIETRYETRLEFIEKEVMEYKEENRKLQDELNSKKNAINSNNNNSKCKRKCQQQASDSYLIATIRGYKTDLSTKDKEISLLKKQIEESSKKVNGKQTLMPQREHGKSKQKLQNNEELITDKIKRMEKELLGVTEMENSEKELKKKNVEATIQDESKMKNVLIHQLPDIKVHSPSHTK